MPTPKDYKILTCAIKPENKEKLKNHLQKSGSTISAFLRATIDNYLEEKGLNDAQ